MSFHCCIILESQSNNNFVLLCKTAHICVIATYTCAKGSGVLRVLSEVVEENSMSHLERKRFISHAGLLIITFNCLMPAL